MNNILLELQQIFRKVFDDDTLILTRELGQGDIEDWDSLEHINIVMQVEKKFNIKFNMEDIMQMKTIGDFVDAIEKQSRGC